MDILIHTLSGAAVASAAACVVFEKTKDRFKLLALGAFAGALPDVDALSMWSGFDATFGKWFSLQETGGDIYSGSHWYSHHVFMHSLLASVFFPVVFIGAKAAIKKQKPTRLQWMKGLVFTISFNGHLAGDLPTPGGSWDGIAYFFPSSHYLGGLGLTHWWNNYDIFLILLLCVIINTVVILLVRKKQWICSIVLTVSITLCVVQLHRRHFDFNSKQYTYEQRSQKSLELQKEFLGETVFNAMRKFDESLPVHF